VPSANQKIGDIFFICPEPLFGQKLSLVCLVNLDSGCIFHISKNENACPVCGGKNYA
jgi:hypothetical protein